ncbi:Concanavalin A-like lectin/glucanases superfamily [Penicillium citrinum]|uniref:Concanavalin A-like lectin/glucanases superfamily n=2 Tax=Penicillium TaxID=5073 RepID=A0A9W9TRY9_PENCI|nr:Concanavalin A-like lectin/glucanases superfamily [Penicillium citrinum]KAJ5234894.1 Concanavalin A-like lectin/glucanases superfamily [Penicillium citrinum]
MEADVAITGNDTVLGSLGATGLNMDLGANSSSSASSSSASDSVPTNSGGGSGGMSGTNSSSSSGSSSGSGSSTSSGSGAAATTTGFSQGGQDNGAPAVNERALRGSLFAVLVAVVVLVTL